MNGKFSLSNPSELVGSKITSIEHGVNAYGEAYLILTLTNGEKYSKSMLIRLRVKPRHSGVVG